MTAWKEIKKYMKMNSRAQKSQKQSKREKKKIWGTRDFQLIIHYPPSIQLSGPSVGIQWAPAAVPGRFSSKRYRK